MNPAEKAARLSTRPLVDEPRAGDVWEVAKYPRPGRLDPCVRLEVVRQHRPGWWPMRYVSTPPVGHALAKAYEGMLGFEFEVELAWFGHRGGLWPREGGVRLVERG